MANYKVHKFYEDVKKLDLRRPVAEITALTGFAKSNVSEYLSGRKEPSENFLKKFYEVFTVPEVVTSSLLHEPEPGLNYDGKKLNINSLFELLNKQADTIKNQQETIHYLTVNGNKSGRAAAYG